MNSFTERFSHHPGRHCLYIAEIGLNHNGSLERALEMIDLAAEGGADLVKFQTFEPHLMNSVFTSSLLEGKGCSFEDTSQIDFLSSLTLTKEDYQKIVQRCNEKDVTFFSAPFDTPSIELLDELEVPLFKVASSEVTNHFLLEELGKRGKPVILSTGMAGEEEIGEALDVLKKEKDIPVALLHCVSLYPYESPEANIQRVTALKERFNVTVGLSDHSRKNLSAVVAATLGAEIFEKHFTVDRDYLCPDKDVSIDRSEFQELVESVEEAVILKGSSIAVSAREESTARAARRSLFAARSMDVGHIIAREDIIALRPGIGLSPSNGYNIIGRKSVTSIKKGVLLTEEMFSQ